MTTVTEARNGEDREEIDQPRNWLSDLQTKCSKGLWAEVVAVTPTIAKLWLSTSSNQRRLRRFRVEAYCRDRRADRFKLTHQGIAFDDHARQCDGQHRLAMVVESGITTSLFVAYGVPHENVDVIDWGLIRSMRDRLLMADKGEWSESATAVARIFLKVPGHASSMKLSILEIEDILVSYSDAISFAVGNLPTRTSGISRSIRTLVARAFYRADRERLRTFCEILISGLPSHPKRDQAAIVLRNFLLRTVRHSGTLLETERYRKGQAALAAFLREQPIQRVYGTSDDLFPLPTEDEKSCR